jgi:hypothetical protein
MRLIRITQEDVDAGRNMGGFEAAKTCASCGKPVPTQMGPECVGWTARLDEPAIAYVAGYPLHSVYCPECSS